jgi:glutaredoxin
VLYSNECPKCKILKQKLDDKNILYEVCDDIDLMIEKGFRSMPVLELNGEVMNYLEAVNYIKENF